MSDPADEIPFDLRALEAFLAVCDAGTMSAAARHLGVTQSAVSQTLAEMEARLGVALFARRPLKITAAGTLLRQRASALLAEARRIAPLIRETRRGKLPFVRIGLVDSLARLLTAPLAAAFMGRAEHVTIHSGLTAAHASALFTRELDIFIGADALADAEGLERWPVMREPYILLLPRGLRAPRDPAGLARLARERPLVRYSARSRTGIDIERHLRRLGVEAPRRVEFDTPTGVAAMVAAGHGFAITTPLCMLEASVATETLRQAPLPGPALSRQLTLIGRRQEFGTLARDTAATSRALLQKHALPAIARATPWAISEILIGEGARSG